MTIESINKWHIAARPNPDTQALNVQLGCHLEEVCEMFEASEFTNQAGITTLGEDHSAYVLLKELSKALKAGQIQVDITNRKLFADSLGDQVVTAVGVGHCAHMNTPEIIRRVDTSNWTKFVNGVPQFHANGKIAKASTYEEPNLEGTY